MAKPISETIRMFQGGDFNLKCGELFASVLRGVEDTGKAGKLTITLAMVSATAGQAASMGS